MTVGEFFARWREINNYLALFPPFKGESQKLDDDEIIELIYDKLPKCMKGDLERMNEFDINDTNLVAFRNALECLELSYELDAKDDDKQQSKSSTKQHGKKHNRDKKDSPSRTSKRPCMLHDKDDHTSDECRVLRNQAERMKAMWKAQSSSECARIHREHEQTSKTPSQKEIHQMVVDSVEKTVKPMIQEMFQMAFKKGGKRACNASADDSDSENEFYGIKSHLNDNLGAAVDALTLE